MFKLAAYLDGFSSKKDGSAGLRFSTQELQPSDFSTLQSNNGAFGWLVFSPNEVQASDVPTQAAEDKNKTPSKRLRASLFVLWQQRGKQGDFERFYVEQMDKVIDFIKSKLD